MKSFLPHPRRELCAAFGLAAILAFAPVHSFAQLSPGDIVVIDIDANFDASTPGEGALVRVHPVTGMRTVLSDFGNPTQGPLGRDPLGMTLEASGTILVVDRGAGTRGLLFRINPATGIRTVLSDFGNAAQGPIGGNPMAVAVEASGAILVTGTELTHGFHGTLFRIDPVTGNRAVLSDFENPAQGPFGSPNVFGVTVEPSGMILVADQDGGTGASGLLFRVNPATGARTILSSFGNLAQGPEGNAPSDAALESPGTILVADPAAPSSTPPYSGALFRISPSTGVRIMLSNFGNAAQGPVGSDPYGVAVESSGMILVADGSGPTGSNGILFRINPGSGMRTVLSDFANPAQGPVSQPTIDPFGGVQPGRNTPLRVAVVGAVDCAAVWTDHRPTPRYGHAMAYDNTRGRLVVFGGTGHGYLGDTWESNGGNWTQVSTTGPAPRSGHAMAYDSARGRVVLFGGGNYSGYVGDTWEWNGSVWTQVSNTGPSPRFGHAMAYDSARGRTVLFGGYGGADETWEWDGSTWTPVAISGPTGRINHAMVYDSSRSRVVLFGGDVGNPVGDTWEWNGTIWTQVSNSGPAPRYLHAMAYDSAHHRTVLFGGDQGGDYLLGDTWGWDGNAWTQLAEDGGAGAASRWGQAMAYDSVRNRVVLFGGVTDPFRETANDVWELDGSVWTDHRPSPRYGHAMAYDNTRGRLVVFGGTGHGYLGDTWESNGGNWTQVSTAGPAPRSGHAMAYDSARGRVVLFGGVSDSGYVGDTWEWNGSVWTQVSNTGPSPRNGHAMAYDSARSRTVFFGGYGGADETWEWDGSTWTPVAISGPTGRTYHAMVYDSSRSRVVLFGGDVGNPVGDTWEWNGTIWTQVSNSGPAPRYLHAMAYDSAHHRTVLFGGDQGGDYLLGDTWGWDGHAWTQLAEDGGAGTASRLGQALAYDSVRNRVVLFGGVTDPFRVAANDVWEFGCDIANTPTGSTIGVEPVDSTTGGTPTSLMFSQVTVAGTTSLTTSSTGPTPPSGFNLGEPAIYYDLTTTAVYSGSITVCINYSGVTFQDETQLKLFHFEDGTWVDRTISLDPTNHIICANVTSLSPFAIFEQSAVMVSIDIKPGAFPNSINLGSSGTVPVAVLSTASFDARTVDPLTVTLANAPVRLRGNGTPMASFEDINHDGFLDLLVHVRTEALELRKTDTKAVLEGRTFSRKRIRGIDSIRVVP